MFSRGDFRNLCVNTRIRLLATHSFTGASCVGPQHDRGRSDTVMISMNFDSYATLAIFCIIPGPVLFLNSNFIYYTSVSCVSVLLLYLSLQSLSISEKRAGMYQQKNQTKVCKYTRRRNLRY